MSSWWRVQAPGAGHAQASALTCPRNLLAGIEPLAVDMLAGGGRAGSEDSESSSDSFSADEYSDDDATDSDATSDASHKVSSLARTVHGAYEYWQPGSRGKRSSRSSSAGIQAAAATTLAPCCDAFQLVLMLRSAFPSTGSHEGAE